LQDAHKNIIPTIAYQSNLDSKRLFTILVNY